MKILFVTDGFVLGGLQRVNTVIGRELSKKNEVYYYALSSKENYFDIEKNLVFGINSSEKKIIRKIKKSPRILESFFNDGQYKPWRYIKKGLNHLAEYIEENLFNVIIVNSPHLISCIPYLTKKVNTKKSKWVAWNHSSYDVYINNYARRYKSEYIKGLQLADQCICLTKSDLENFKQITDKVTCLYNPLTIEESRISELNKKNISFTSRLAFEAKGIDRLPALIKKLPDEWTVTIAGGGTRKEKKRLQSMIKKNKLQSRLIYAGSLKGQNLVNHYLNSSIYLMTSRWEGFGLVLAEAMNFGLPIVSFEQSGANEVLDYGKYGILIKNGDTVGLAQAINNIIENNEFKKYQKLSLERVKAFDLTNIANQWQAMLDELIEERV